MSVYRRKGSKVFAYDFEYKGRRYRGSTGQITRQDAELIEGKKKLGVRRIAGGIQPAEDRESPSFQDWAEIYFEHIEKRVTRPDAKEYLIRSILEFWGAPSAASPATPAAPRHDLRLGDVLDDPSWILQWEDWLTARDMAGQTKNHYRTIVSHFFRLAMHPNYRKQTNIAFNPFAGQWRDPTSFREVIIEREDLLAILAQASWHLRLAIAIAMLAPKLRLGNILALRWDEHVSKDFTAIHVTKHKTAYRTHKPLVVHVPDQLREILTEAKRRAGKSKFVVTYQGAPMSQLNDAVRGAVRRAAKDRPHLTYGRAEPNGITFHTLRHTAATLLAELDVSPEKRQQIMGHRDLASTMRYTHLQARHEATTAEQLSAALPELKELVLMSRKRPPVGESDPTARATRADSRRKTPKDAT